MQAQNDGAFQKLVECVYGEPDWQSLNKKPLETPVILNKRAVASIVKNRQEAAHKPEKQTA